MLNHPAELVHDGRSDALLGIWAIAESIQKAGLEPAQSLHPGLGVQCLLIGEMVVDRSHADTCIATNVLQACPECAFTSEALGRCEDDSITHHAYRIIFGDAREILGATRDRVPRRKL